MKTFDYYNNVPAPYVSRNSTEVKEMRNRMVEEINNTPLTHADREERLADVEKKIVAFVKQKSDEYRAAQNSRRREFFEDARKELGYGDFLNEKGCSLLEEKAWEDGHSSGFEEEFIHLVRLVEIVDLIIRKGMK